MSHLSIGIIRKPSQEEKDGFDYLVLDAGNGKVKFFDYENPAIGSSFDYTSFTKHLSEYFDLQGVRFESTGFLKQSPRDPFATAYIYGLSDVQVTKVSEKLAAGGEKWQAISWVFEERLRERSWIPSQNFLFAKESAFRKPSFTNEYRASLRNIATARSNGKLVVFAGAGISTDSGVPGWAQLVTALREDMSTKEEDYLKVCELYSKSRGEKEYFERISQILNHGKTRYNPLHKKITDLSPVHIVTTNFDHHFEQIIEEKALRYSIVRQDIDLPFSKGSSLYVKMHGDLDRKQIVLTESDYHAYKDTFPLIDSFVRETFASKLVLFVGFSFRDPNLIQIIESVKGILGQSLQRPYLFTPEQIDENNRVQFQEKGIELLTFETAIDEYFDQIRTAEDEESHSAMTVRGKRTYSFLRVLEEFDTVSDGLENLSIESQLVKSLQRFKELGAIPQSVLQSLIPFRLKRQPRYDTTTNASFSHWTPIQLETLNEEILGLFENLKNADGKVAFYNYQNPYLQTEAQHLHDAIAQMYNSGVHHVIRKNDTGANRWTLVPIGSEKQCQCPRCLFDRLDFKKLLPLLETTTLATICSNGVRNIGLTAAYSYFKTGQPMRSFSLLEGVKNDALRNQQYLTYFIACYNQVLLKFSLQFRHELDLAQTELDAAVQKIEAIDLYEVLSELPLERELKSCLKYLLDGNPYRHEVMQIHSDCEEIRKTYVRFKRGGYFMSGPYYWHKVETRVFLIWNFYHKNCLFADFSPEFLELADQYLEAMIASYMTSKEYSQRLKEFSPFFCHIFTRYGSAKSLHNLLSKYKATGFKFTKRSELFEQFHSMVRSGYETSNFFGERVNRNVSHHILANRSASFEGKIVSILDNTLVIFQYIELTHEEINRVVKDVVDFVSVSECFMGAGSLDHFMNFVTRNVSKVDIANLRRLVGLLLSDKLWSGQPLTALSGAYIKGSVQGDVLDEALMTKFMQRIGPRSEWPFEVREAIPVYSMLNSEQKKKFAAVVRNEIETKPETIPHSTLKQAYEWGIINPINDKNIFKPLFDSVEKSTVEFPEYRITRKGQVRVTSSMAWNDLFFVLRIIYKYDLFDKEMATTIRGNLKDEMFQWILSPKQFDYSKLKAKWLLVFSSVEFTEKLKDIGPLKDAVVNELEKKFNPSVAKVFFQRFAI
ncbi:MAG: SIR2 family protein [Cyclobacteriaceae bacterium]|nr:SIR2 family protein [Cyclobacteriaceae bacterium]